MEHSNKNDKSDKNGTAMKKDSDTRGMTDAAGTKDMHKEHEAEEVTAGTTARDAE